jgi:hypothetical protein
MTLLKIGLVRRRTAALPTETKGGQRQLVIAPAFLARARSLLTPRAPRNGRRSACPDCTCQAGWMSIQPSPSASGPPPVSLLLACELSRKRFRAWRRSVQNSVQNCCADVLVPSGRGTCAWLWRLVPFAVQNGIGWPIIRILHRLLLRRNPFRRCPGGIQLNGCRWSRSPRRVRAGSVSYVDTATLVDWASLRPPCGAGWRGTGGARLADPLPMADALQSACQGEVGSVGQRPGEAEDGKHAVVSEAGHGGDLAAGECEYEYPAELSGGRSAQRHACPTVARRW